MTTAKSEFPKRMRQALEQVIHNWELLVEAHRRDGEEPLDLQIDDEASPALATHLLLRECNIADLDALRAFAFCGLNPNQLSHWRLFAEAFGIAIQKDGGRPVEWTGKRRHALYHAAKGLIALEPKLANNSIEIAKQLQNRGEFQDAGTPGNLALRVREVLRDPDADRKYSNPDYWSSFYTEIAQGLVDPSVARRFHEMTIRDRLVLHSIHLVKAQRLSERKKWDEQIEKAVREKFKGEIAKMLNLSTLIDSKE